MSKAFTKEGDGSDDDVESEGPVVPVGVKNYITPAGARKLQEELKHLVFKERPEVTQVVSWAAGNGDRSENGDYIYGKKRLREIDRRIRFLNKRLESVEVVDPLKVKCDQVRFGATVTIRDEDDNEKTYSIVGIDETDLSRGRISWISPLANALLKAHEGDYVTFRSPKGVQNIEVVRIEYKNLEDGD
jgi:transcription elongation factor GreB